MNSIMAISGKRIATQVAWHFLGTPYRWGGDDPSSFDCSGFCIELLKSTGVLPRRGDWTANDLYNKFKTVPSASEGTLACYYNRAGDRIIHIEYCLNRTHTIGASGGGSRTLTLEDAHNQNAYVKIRPVNSQRGRVVFVDPFHIDDE